MARWLRGRNLERLPGLLTDSVPLDLRLVGRTLLHAALVGLAAGLAGAAFLASLEAAQRFLVEGLAGYRPLRAHGEHFFGEGPMVSFRPWVLLLLPAFGGLVCGWLARFAPEIAGGGGDAAIDAFHQGEGRVRRRVLLLKPVASVFTLGTGGAGGREGPTMQLGAALGAFVARHLHVGVRERRILLVAGIAAGISAVFRTPLGAALLAVEILYRDGFESDALVPSILASVIAYSVVVSIFGESTLFAHAHGYPFLPRHLIWYGLMAICLSLLAVLFLVTLRTTRRLIGRVPGPAWLRPAYGGLLLGALITPVLVVAGRWIPAEGQGLGILGGGYGAVQVAISGSDWLPAGWAAVGLLGAMSLAKLVAASFTIGSGGSAGDFAPSLAIGGLFGGAFGRAAQLLLADPTIDPGAFALVGMGVFYGGIAHVPLASLVLVCELAGNYDLIVPLMLGQGIAFVALRKRALYHAQPATLADSPVHRENALVRALGGVRVREVMSLPGAVAAFSKDTPAHEMLRLHGEAVEQEVFPVREGENVVGVVTADALRVLASQPDGAACALAADLAQPFLGVHPDDDLRLAAERLVGQRVRALLVLDERGRLVGFLDETRIAEAAIGRAAPSTARETPAGGAEMAASAPPRSSRSGARLESQEVGAGSATAIAAKTNSSAE
ncbi:MAG TPA: chloride channel protein [Vulgatibacter sp.]